MSPRQVAQDEINWGHAMLGYALLVANLYDDADERFIPDLCLYGAMSRHWAEPDGPDTAAHSWLIGSGIEMAAVATAPVVMDARPFAGASALAAACRRAFKAFGTATRLLAQRYGFRRAVPTALRGEQHHA